MDIFYFRSSLVRFVLFVFAFCRISGESNFSIPNQNAFPVGHPQRCVALLGRKVNTFEVLPGTGWDNLANEQLGQALEREYRHCRLTEDGVYLIPDHVNVIPIKESNVGLFAEFTESMQSYKSVTSSSINGHVSASVGLPETGMGVSGSFAAAHQQVKLHMSTRDKKTFVSRVTAEYNRYKVDVQPDAPLTPALKKRVLEIAESYQLNNKPLGRYLSEVLVRDFGTHVVTSVDAGAIYAKQDIIEKEKSFDLNSQSRGLKIGAGFSFSAMFESEIGPINVSAQFGVGYKTGYSVNEINAYQKQVSQTYVTAIGGKPIGYASKKETWVDSLDNNLVATDKRGKPIHEFISTFTLPEIPSSLVVDVQNSVKNAFVAYYRHNTYRGCTDPNAKNFDIAANVDSGACDSNETDALFGGAFQLCTDFVADHFDYCSSYRIKNPLTQDYTCPDGYLPVKLVKGDLFHQLVECDTKQTWFWTKCHPFFKFVYGFFESYWCAVDKSKTQTTFHYFGGIYTSSRPNDITNKMSCSDGFQTITLGHDIHICLGSTAVPGYAFGGLFSCQYGNRMSQPQNRSVTDDKLPKMCPSKTFNQMFITNVDDCEIEFCSNIKHTQNSPGNLPALRRPPFMKHPRPNKQQTSKHDLILLSDQGEWFTNADAYEKMVELQDLELKVSKYQKSSVKFDKLSTAWSDLTPAQGDTDTGHPDGLTDGEDSPTAMSTPVIATIASLATALFIVVTTLAVITWRSRRRSGRSKGLYAEVESLTTVEVDGETTPEVETEINTINVHQVSSYGSSQ